MSTKFSLFLLAALSVMAQRPPVRVQRPPTAASSVEGTGSIAGRILDAATGAPVKRAVVTLEGQSQNGRMGRTMSGDDGSYLLKDLAKGQIWITAEKTGYLRGGYRAQVSGSAGDPVEMKDGTAKTGIDILLAKQGVISGRVLDEAGEPAERVLVQAIPVREASSRASGPLATQTNDLGEFRLAKLPLGMYRLLANRGPERGDVVVEQVPGKPATAEAPTYFPGTLDAQSASAVKVNAGEERTGVEIRLQRSTVVRVAGRVAGEMPEGRGARVVIRSSQEGGAFRGGFMGGAGGDGVIGPDGSFAFRHMRPGEYTLTVMSMGRGLPKIMGKTSLMVGQTDVQGVTINSAAAPRVDGRIRAAGEPPFAFGRVEVSLQSAIRQFYGIEKAMSQDDGSFSFPAVSRDIQTLAVKTPQGVIVKEVYAAGQLLPSLEIDFATVSGPLEIVLSNKPGTITGTIDGTKPDAPRVAVWAVPETEPLRIESWSTRKIRVESASPTFTLDSLRPGSYRLAAVEDIESDALNEAAVWEKLKAQTSTVKVGEGESAQVKLKLIPASEVADQ